MLEDMRVRDPAGYTQREYLYRVARFFRYLGCPPGLPASGEAYP